MKLNTGMQSKTETEANDWLVSSILFDFFEMTDVRVLCFSATLRSHRCMTKKKHIKDIRKSYTMSFFVVLNFMYGLAQGVYWIDG